MFVWIGNGTTAAEKHNAMPYAHVRFDLLIYNALLFCCAYIHIELSDEVHSSSCSCNLLGSGKRNETIQ